MAEKATLDILRYSEETGRSVFSRYSVPVEGKTSVLQALLHIYEHIDSTLGFRYGCRYKRCGLCGIEIDGKPCLACVSILNENQYCVLKPMKGFRIIKDLIIDRSFTQGLFTEYSLFIPKQHNWKEKIIVSKEFHEIMGCMECLRCVSVCPNWNSEEPYEFGGPYAFIKLAQLYLDPRDNIDRLRQAVDLGIKKCASCNRICVQQTGCKTCNTAITVLLNGINNTSY